jgi:plastocyanin
MNKLHTVTSSVLAAGAIAFVLLLAGVGSGALTTEPPAISPYATGSGSTTTTVDSSSTSAATVTTVAVATTSPATTTSPTDAAAADVTIVISGFAFGDPLTVPAGTTVAATNADGAGHTWTSRDGLWDSGTLRGSDVFTFTFETPGEYGFFCAIHGSMTGTITVTG